MQQEGRAISEPRPPGHDEDRDADPGSPGPPQTAPRDVVDVALHPRPPWDRPEQRAGNPALYDELTLLPNRDLLLDRLAMALTRTHRSGEPLALVRCEVDGTGGPTGGPGPGVILAALPAIGKRLERSVRSCDTVARGHGDELILLCERLTHPDDIAVVLARVHEAMRESIEVAGVAHHLTLSLGAVITNDPMLEFDELFDEAGDLLDAARAEGPGRSRMSDWSFQLFGQAAAVLDHRHQG